MSLDKRPAPDGLGASQIVKRQRSDADMGSSSAMTLSTGTARNSSLTLAVSYLSQPCLIQEKLKELGRGLEG